MNRRQKKKRCRTKGYMRRKMLTKYDSVADFYEARLKGDDKYGQTANKKGK